MPLAEAASNASFPHTQIKAKTISTNRLPSPINAINLLKSLEDTDYDTVKRNFLYLGFLRGFSLGFNGVPNSDIDVKNKATSELEKQAISEAISKELKHGRICGPFSILPFSSFQVNPISVVKKKNGSYRMITNLSSPAGKSVNDGIPDEFARVSYASLDTAIKLVISRGQGAFLAKSDIKSAFRLLPIAPDDYHLLCFHWENSFYFDACLPMGARSSCALFEEFSSAIEHILRSSGYAGCCHYLDDFLFIGRSREECENHLQAFKAVCSHLNVPIALEKTFGPDNVLEFLGFQIDTVEQSVKLPSDKLKKGIELISEFLRREKCKLTELQGLLGFLNFTCTVILPGRAFLVRLYSLLSKASRPFHRIRLTASVKNDLLIWHTFLSDYNGKSLYREQLFQSDSAVEIFTDASGSLGFAAVMGRLWFSGTWPSSWWQAQNIFLLELIPVFLALSTWADTLANKIVILRVDNEALVHVLNKQTSKDEKVMFLIRKLVLLCLRRNIQIRAVHIFGAENLLADALSRQKIEQFFYLFPTAVRQPVAFPVLPNTLSFKQRQTTCTQAL